MDIERSMFRCWNSAFNYCLYEEGENMKKAKHTGKEVTIVGVVEEIEDEEGNSGLIISTDDDAYEVELNKQGKRLFQEVDMDVEVTGFVTKNDDGTKRITVTGFDVLDSDDDDDYDDDDDDFGS
ncbi:MAG TPA: hypothetical protein VMW06_08740 [Desulfobacterales bacterium]|nr:hypothetical protein [Desulfobacterales bacterium]